MTGFLEATAVGQPVRARRPAPLFTVPPTAVPLRWVRVLWAACVVAVASSWFVGCAGSPDVTTLAIDYYNIGAAYIDLGNSQRAVEYLARAFELDPALSRAGFGLARAYVELRRYDEAISLLIDLQQIDPENTVVLETLAYAQFRNGDTEAAQRIYEQLLERPAVSSSVYFNHALVVRETDPQAARRSLNQLLAVEPNDLSAVKTAGLWAWEDEAYEDAASFLTQYTQRSPDDIDYGLMLVQSLEALEAYDLALTAVERVLSRRPGHPHALFIRGRILVLAVDDTDASSEALVAAAAAGFSDADEWAILLELVAEPARTTIAAALETARAAAADDDGPAAADGPPRAADSVP